MKQPEFSRVSIYFKVSRAGLPADLGRLAEEVPSYGGREYKARLTGYVVTQNEKEMGMLISQVLPCRAGKVAPTFWTWHLLQVAKSEIPVVNYIEFHRKSVGIPADFFAQPRDCPDVVTKPPRW